MNRIRRFLRTPFGATTLALLLLAAWATWTAGVFDGPVAREVRTSSVYVAPGIDVDQAAAERIIGNRRLVVVFLERGADLGDRCDDLDDAAAGTIAVLLSPGDGEFEHYGCSNFGDDEEFGKAFVSETVVPGGADQFLDRPLEALKVMAVNYDSLVRSGTLPDGARTIEPSLPRYLLAAAAMLTVLIGAATLYLLARRAGTVTAGRQDDREAAADARTSLNAKAAVLATYVIELDRDHPHTKKHLRRRYRQLAADYAQLVPQLMAGKTPPGLATRVDELTTRARNLARASARDR